MYDSTLNKLSDNIIYLSQQVLSMPPDARPFCERLVQTIAQLSGELSALKIMVSLLSRGTE